MRTLTGEQQHKHGWNLQTKWWLQISITTQRLKINIAAENESKVTYRIDAFRYFESVERVDHLGIIYGDGQFVPAETFMNAVEDPDQCRCYEEVFDVTVDFGKIGGAMENAKLCHLEKGRCSPEVKIENGQVTEIFWGDV